MKQIKTDERIGKTNIGKQWTPEAKHKKQEDTKTKENLRRPMNTKPYREVWKLLKTMGKPKVNVSKLSQ